MPLHIIDNLDTADAEARKRAAHLIEQGDEALIMTCESVRDIPHEVLTAWRNGAVERVDLRALTDEETHQFILRALECGLPRSLSFQIRALTAGNPLLIREFIESLVQYDDLEWNGYTWTWDGNIRNHERVREAIAPELNRLNAEALSLLQALALSHRMSMIQASDFARDISIARLVSAGFVHEERTLAGERILTICAEVVALAISSGLSAKISTLLLRRIGEPVDPAALMFLCLARVSLGRKVSILHLLTSSRFAYEIKRCDIVRALAQAALETEDIGLDHEVQLRLVRAQSLHLAGRHAHALDDALWVRRIIHTECERRLNKRVTGTPRNPLWDWDDQQLFESLLACSVLLTDTAQWGLGQPREVDEALLGTYELVCAFSERNTSLAGYAVALGIIDISRKWALGLPSAIHNSLIARLVETQPLSMFDVALAPPVLFTLAQRGNIHETLQLADRVVTQRKIHGIGVDVQESERLWSSIITARFLVSRWGGETVFPIENVGKPDHVASYDTDLKQLALGMLATNFGSWSIAKEEFRSAVSETQRADPLGRRYLYHALYAQSLAACGELESAANELAEVDALSEGNSFFSLPETTFAVLSCALAVRESALRDRIDLIETKARKQGLWLVVVIARYFAVFACDNADQDSTLEALRDAAQRVDGSLVTAFVAHAQAFVEQDDQACVHTRQTLLEDGYWIPRLPM
ncbi:hypothetical protein [Timonella sp. A28]|uniref:hypothetical protein n=1 Tax=Timonella sp. A28 TaxID=3442640 RepID=UPI003EC021AF